MTRPLDWPAGAVRYVTKPFRNDQLLALVAEIVADGNVHPMQQPAS